MRSSFQEEAKPASGSAKTKDFRPTDENIMYPWKHGAYKNTDTFKLETAAGKLGFGSISLLEHVRDLCIFQEMMRHLKKGKHLVQMASQMNCSSIFQKECTRSFTSCSS